MNCISASLSITILLFIQVAITNGAARPRYTRDVGFDMFYESECVTDGHKDFWCLTFCPFIHNLFLWSLTETLACSFGLEDMVDCSQVTNACTEWCSHLHMELNQDYVSVRPHEWDTCARGDKPEGCDDDPDCVKWCGWVYGSYKNVSSPILQCMNTGTAPSTCDSEKFCQDVCDTARFGASHAPDIIITCGFTGKAPWP